MHSEGIVKHIDTVKWQANQPDHQPNKTPGSKQSKASDHAQPQHRQQSNRGEQYERYICKLVSALAFPQKFSKVETASLHALKPVLKFKKHSVADTQMWEGISNIRKDTPECVFFVPSIGCDKLVSGVSKLQPFLKMLATEGLDLQR